MQVKVPEWSDLVKLGRFNELSPVDVDWYYTRTASIARHLYIRSPAGVGAFRKVYGAKKRRGTQPPTFCKADGNILRKALQVSSSSPPLPSLLSTEGRRAGLQTLESLKWVEKVPEGGRRLTKQGRKDLDRIAVQIKTEAPPPAIVPV